VGRIERLKGAHPAVAALHAELVREGDRLLTAPSIAYVKEGRRLLHDTREALRRILLLSHLELLTGDRKYLDAATAEMLRLAALPDWNPSHFLDTAEAAAGLAIGYDWLHPRLAPETRSAIREALVSKALRPALDPALSEFTWFWKRDNNWNQVCIGGLVLAALAIAEDEPELAREILDRGREGIVHSQPPYAPDGVYPEGPSYWSYGTAYQVLLIEALRTALGTDWALPASPGFLGSSDFMVHSTGPDGRSFNFADGGEGRGISPALFWFARERNAPELLHGEWSRMAALAEPKPGKLGRDEGNRFLPLLFHWAPEPGTVRAGAVPSATDWVGHGDNPVAFHRTGWGSEAAWLGVKGGRGSVNHAHLDAGSFVFCAQGIRWAIDLGKQDYFSLESKGISLWGKGQDAERWKVFRLNNHSHNTLTVGDRLHRVDADAPILSHSASPDDRHTTIDLTGTLGDEVRRAHRTFRMAPDGVVEIEDAIGGISRGTGVRWALHTRAEVRCAGTVATLAQAGKTLEARILSPEGARFESAPLPEPTDGFNAPNPGVSRLWIDLPSPASGELRIVVRLEPASKR